MLVSAPIWLIALIPWSGLAVWLLSGSRKRAAVPFLPLWQGPVDGPRSRRRLHVPPASIALLLAAMFLAILAAARPRAPRPRNQIHGALSLIVDRGFTMSAHGARDLRFREAADQALAALRERFADCQLTLMSVPDGATQTLSLDQCASTVRNLPPCGLDTRDELAAAIRQASGSLLVISDQLIDQSDQVIEVPPPTAVRDVAIVRVAAREQPVAQVMLQIRNQSPQSSAMVAIRSGRQTVQRAIPLPAAPQERNYFFSLPEMDSTISVQLELHDDVDEDKEAWLVREGEGVRVEPHFAISPELRRLVEVYTRSRPSGRDAEHLPVVRLASDAPSNAPAIIMPPARGLFRPTAVHVHDHMVTQFCSGQALAAGFDVTDDLPPQGWTPLLDADGRVLVAARPKPPNQLWVGFDAPGWAATPDFVVFWTNAFDWAGGAGESMAAHGLPEWDSQWKPLAPSPADHWPGLYRRGDGVVHAFNPPDVPIPQPRETHWREGIAALAAEPGRLDLSPWLLIAALACLALASIAWAAPRTARARRD